MAKIGGMRDQGREAGSESHCVFATEASGTGVGAPFDESSGGFAQRVPAMRSTTMAVMLSFDPAAKQAWSSSAEI